MRKEKIKNVDDYHNWNCDRVYNSSWKTEMNENSIKPKNKCFEEHKGKDGKCHGIYGGDRFTDYLSYSCIGCKHLDLIVKNKKENKEAYWRISESGELFCPFCGYCAQFGAKLNTPKE